MQKATQGRQRVPAKRPPYRKIFSVSKIDSRTRALAQRIRAEQGRAILHINGKKTAVLITYEEYQQFEKLRTAQMKEELLAKLPTHPRQQKDRQRVSLNSFPHPSAKEQSHKSKSGISSIEK